MAQAAAFIPAALTIAGMVVGKQGADQGAAGARLAAQRTAVAKQFEAEQLRINAGQQIAAGQQAAFEQERQARLVASRQVALAAASVLLLRTINPDLVQGFNLEQLLKGATRDSDLEQPTRPPERGVNAGVEG